MPSRSRRLTFLRRDLYPSLRRRLDKLMGETGYGIRALNRRLDDLIDAQPDESDRLLEESLSLTYAELREHLKVLRQNPATVNLIGKLSRILATLEQIVIKRQDRQKPQASENSDLNPQRLDDLIERLYGDPL